MKQTFPALAGVIAGVVASMVFSRQAPREAGTTSDAMTDTMILPAASAAREPPLPVPPWEEHIRRSEERIESLERSSRRPAQGAETERLFEEPLDIQRARMVEAHQRLIEDHFREPVDSGWAEDTRARFERDLGGLAEEQGFEVVHVDCRTHSCAATFEWASFEEATGQYAAILHRGYDANCTRTILLPEPEDASRPYQATAIFDCQHWKRQQE